MTRHGNRFELLYFLLEDAQAAFHTVGAIGGELHPQGEKPELVIQSLHVRIVLFGFIEDEVPFPVQRFQVGFDTGTFFGLSFFVGMDVKLHVPFPAHLTDQRFEYLLKKGSCSLLFSM